MKSLLKCTYDDYVPYFWSKDSILTKFKLEKSNLIRSLRVKYWHKIASKYPPFSPFFDNALRNKKLSDCTNENIRDIYKSGTTTIKNILNENDLKILSDFISTKELKSNINYIQFELTKSTSFIRQKILKKLFPIYDNFFPLPHRNNDHEKIYVGVRVDFSHDGIDASPATANWHADRFVPTINAIYFPFGSNWGEFEKDIGSPVITQEDFQYYVSARRLNSPTDENYRDQLYYPSKQRVSRKFTLKNNTMLVGTHHIQHRRSPIKTKGQRIAIFIDHYNFFTRHHLKANSLR